MRILLSLVGIIMLGFCLSRTAWAQRPPAPPPRPPAGPLDNIMGGTGGPGAADSEPEPAEPADITPKNDKGYDEDPVDAAGQRKNQLRVGQIILAGKFAAGDQEVFDDYYNKYILARWSAVENLPSLPAYRQDLRNQFKRAKSGQVHDELSALALEYMNKLVVGNYHPTVRINAMLIIGDLNGVEQSGNEPPAPLDSAMPALLAAVENSDLSDALRAAAMVGILRHAAAGVRDDNTRKAMIAAMLKIVEEDIPAGAAAPGRQWILGQAIETLGLIGTSGENNAVAKAILKTFTNAKLSFTTRCLAAEALGRLKFAGGGGIDAVDALALLGQFIVDACKNELESAKATEFSISRRRMKYRTNSVLTALLGSKDAGTKGIAGLLRDPAHQAYAADLQKTLDALMENLDDKVLKPSDLEKRVDETRAAVEDWLTKKPK